MALAGEIIHKTPLLVTIRITDNDKEITRNYKRGDYDMLARVIHTSQMVFLSEAFDRGAKSEYMRNRGQYETEAEAVKLALIEQEAA